jgi:hypothetical protein
MKTLLSLLLFTSMILSAYSWAQLSPQPRKLAAITAYGGLTQKKNLMFDKIHKRYIERCPPAKGAFCIARRIKHENRIRAKYRKAIKKLYPDNR